MTGGGFQLPAADSDSDFDSASDSDGPLQTIHVGPRDDGIQMTELGAAEGDDDDGDGDGDAHGMRRRRGRGVKERRVEWVGKPYVVGPEYMKMPLSVSLRRGREERDLC